MRAHTGTKLPGRDVPAAGVKPSTVVAERLRATQEALKAAQSTIEEQDKREKELKRLLVAGGRKVDDASFSSSSVREAEPTTTEAQLKAMKAVHDNKVKALMKSIHQLQDQLQILKSQDKEHRRSALIQNLRTSQRDQELLIDVLKQTLVDKVPEFQESREVVNDFILKKSIGGPLRFRPPPREELENELSVLDGKYKRAVENLKKAKEEVERTTDVRRRQREQSNDCEDERHRVENTLVTTVEREVYVSVSDPVQQEEIDRLRVQLAAKDLTIHAQADEMHELYAEIGRLRLLEEKIERKRDKIEALTEKVNKLQLENVKLVREVESESEKSGQLHDELQFLRDTRVGDVDASDSECLRQLELIQTLRVREMELQNELEEQQKKWAVDRTTVSQQMRLVEKERDLAVEQNRHYEADVSALQKKNDRLYVECESTKEKLSEADQHNRSLQERIQELEGVVALHESRSLAERESQAKTMTERLREMEEALAEKDELAKKLDRQLTASKLLARQSKKEKEQLQDRISKLQEELASRNAIENE